MHPASAAASVAPVLPARSPLPLLRLVDQLRREFLLRFVALGACALALAPNHVAAQTPSPGTWTTRPALPAARSRPAVDAINGIVYVAGGHNNTDTSSLYAYNVATGTWSTLASMPAGRYQASGAGVIDGKLYVPGGWTTSPPLPNNTLFVYDPATNAWSTRAPMPTLSGGGATGVIGGRLYVATAEDGFTGWRNLLHVYDPAANAWTARASSPDAHAGAASGVIAGKFYVVGGVNSVGTVTGRLDVYDPATNTWTTRAPLQTARLSAASAVLNGKLYVYGGSTGTAALSSVEVYDPDTNTWRFDTALSAARSGAAAAVHNGVAYVIGGNTTAGASVSTHESFAVGPLTTFLSGDATLRTPGYMASDGTFLYVAGIGTNNTQGIFRIPLAGGAATRLYNAVGPLQIAILGANIYWIDANSGPATDTQIWRAPLAGGGTPTAIYTGSAVGQPIVDGSGLATDGTSLYAVDEVGGGVFRLNPDGSGLTTNAPARYTGGFATEHLNTIAIANGRIYVADQGRGTLAPEIATKSPSDTAIGRLWGGSPLTSPSGIAAAYDHVFVADPGAGNSLWRLPGPNGAPVALLAGAPFQQIQGVLVVGNDLFISDAGAGAIFKLPGGALPAIASTHALSVATGQTVALALPPAAANSTYRWYFNGAPVGGTEAVLLLSNIGAAQAGTYYCTVSTPTPATSPFSGTVTVITTHAFTVTVGAPGTAGRLINLATRGTVGTGGNILIGGFVVGGTQAKTFLVRGLGPSLAQFGLTGTLADPMLQIFQGATLLYTSDNWGGSTTLSNVFTSVGAFPLAPNTSAPESVLVVTLPPGDYTAQLSGQGSTGIGLIEIFEVP